MAISMKGIFRGLKIIAQIFTVQREEHEIEIGYPTDVRHVSHVGFGASGSCRPSWMNEFRGGVEEVAAAAGGWTGGGGASVSSAAAQSRQTSSWASLDFEQPVGAGVPPPAEASTADSSTACAGTATPRGGASKKPAPRPKKARASSPGSSARSSSWRSTASLAAACRDSDEPRPGGVRAA